MGKRPLDPKSPDPKMTLNQANDWIRAQGAHFTMNDAELSLTLGGHTITKARTGKLEKIVAEMISELRAALEV
jgi:catalase (peroxidase I)